MRANSWRHASDSPATGSVTAGLLPSSPTSAVEIACPKVQAAHR